MDYNQNIPRRGWYCEQVYSVQDSDPDAHEVCQFCGNDRVKVVFVMTHKTYPEKLRADSACIEKLMDNYVDPIIREKEFLNRHRRRNNWLELPWRVSEQGNDFINVSGYNIVIFEDRRQPGKWGYHVKGGSNRKLYDTKDLAKIAVFDMFWQLTHSNQT